MIRLRLTRCGRKKRPFYRLVAANKDAPIKGKYIEMLGHYDPIAEPKKIELNKERIEYWISQGAQPSSTVASICKGQGMKGMDKYMTAPVKKAKRTKPEPEPKASPAPAPAAIVEEKAAEEVIPEPVEEKVEEAAPVAEAPQAEEAPAEEIKEETATETTEEETKD